MASLERLSAGQQVPEDINVIIEIPAQGSSVKYEVDKDSGFLSVDRFMTTAMHYPCNYGFVPQTLAEDGDPVDVLVITPFPVHPGSLLRCRPIGLLQMTDEAGQDSKVLAVPLEKICMEYQHIQALDDVSTMLLESISHFFQHYKDLESNKWVKVLGWEDKDAAFQEIKSGIERYEKAGQTC